MSAPAPDEPVAGEAAPFRPRLKHPRECLPFRPEMRSAWAPGRRDRRDAGRPRPVDPPQRRNPRLVAAHNLGAVRVNFRYASFQSMAAAHSEKAGRDQFFEGPHETHGFRRHECLPLYLDLQYQPITLEWVTPAGVRNSITLDFGVETQDHGIVFGEDKASQDYFDEPALKERLDFAEAFLGERGASLERRVAGGSPTLRQRRIVKDIFDARRTTVDDDVARRVRRMVLQAGGTAPLRAVMDLIGVHPAYALDAARALMFQRVIAMPINANPMPDTPVIAPPPATKGALRAFLANYVED